MWCHFSIGIGRLRWLRFVAIALTIIALITTLVFAGVARAAPATSKTINFQGRLMTAAGAVVADGHYNMQFKIYQGGTGTAAGNPGGSLNWTENHLNNGGTNGVEVKNGFFSVELGSLAPFGASVDWVQDSLFLSMNVAGTATACTTFDSAPCAADGEMLPMKQITATPYAISAGSVGGKTADDLVQLGQGTQTDASNNSSIAINKTGTGNLVQLQASGTDAFTVNNAGSITMGSSANQSISVAASDSGAGTLLAVSAGASASGSNQAGGDLLLQGGAGDGTGTSGDVIVKANGTDTSGTFQVQNAAGDTILNVDAANRTVSTGTLKLAAGSGSGTGPATSLWNDGTISGIAYNDAAPVNLGTTFKSDEAGYVSAVKFYNPAGGNVGGVGKLWACNDALCAVASGGTSLATASFANDTSAGWKTATFGSPVYITANTYYIVTYFSPNGIYYATSGYFNTSYDNAPLHAPDGFETDNGSYNASGSASFPTNSAGAQSNYWVDVTFQAATNVDQISTTNDLIISSAGSMTVGPTGNALKLQGSSINIAATDGGNVTMQGGNATVSNGNGGSITLSGGAGNGTGASGLVVLTTPTFSTVTSDANCYTGGALVASSCSVSQSSVDNASSVIIGFSASDQTATLPDPTIKTAGRIIYVMAASGSSDFTLATSGSTQATMLADTVMTFLWNGTAWITAGGSSSSSLQGGGMSAFSFDDSSLLLDDQVSSSTPEPVTTDTSIDGTGGPGQSMADTSTPFKVGSAASAPGAASDESLLGSMYYDTTLGKLQCYEVNGWGACGASPDIFVTISPEYSNAVMNGTDIGTITSDLCSDTLNINDGSGNQPAICGTDETYNFYKWTTAEMTAQTRSIYVTYQLPATFKQFTPASTSLIGRTDSANANVDYQVYRDSQNDGLITCGSTVPVASGNQSSWNKATATDGADPSTCGFEAGDSILFRINLTAKSTANAYVSNLSFVFSND